MHRLHAAFTAPVWLAQAAWVALATPRLSEAAGPRCGRIGAGRLRLLILGDSSAAGVGVAQQEQALAGRLVAALGDREPEWRLLARSGATTTTVLRWLERMPPTPLDVAVLALGVNDVTRAVPLRRWLDRQRRLAGLLCRDFGVRRLYLTGVPPMGAFPALPRPLRDVLGRRAGRFDEALRLLVADLPGARHLPFDLALLDPAMMAADGYHPGAAIHELWAAELARLIRADFPAPDPNGVLP